MEKTYKRQTVAAEIAIDGVGLHSGVPVRVVVHPGESGIRFRGSGEWIDASPVNVTDTSRCTRLGDISTIEHLMSSFAGMGITDADVEVVGGELPAAGGCAVPYVDAILGVGLLGCGDLIVNGPFARVFLQELPTKYAVGTGEGWWRAVYVRDDEFIGRQEFELEYSPERFAVEVAPARTFALESELEMAKQYGLGKGLDETSCLMVGDGRYINESRFRDEPARHKLLDLIGDLALSGVPVAHLDVVAEFTGHRWNVEVARKLMESVTITRI
ncbi:MAG: UDP-3-O-acyl-N-acetylglucosamine deacetylase [Fimbriimonadaceae bacterium]